MIIVIELTMHCVAKRRKMIAATTKNEFKFTVLSFTIIAFS